MEGRQQAFIIFFYGIMTVSKALGMDSSDAMFYLLFGMACIFLVLKYWVTSYTLREVFVDVLLLAAGLLCFIVSRDMTVLLLAATLVGLKGCDFKTLIHTAFAVRLAITSVMIIFSFLGIFDQGETAQTTTSFQDITVYHFGYSTANNAYINLFLLVVLFLYVNYERINWKYFAGTSVLAVLMYTFTNSRTGTMLFFVLWLLIFCDKFLLGKKGRTAFFGLIAYLPLVCALFSFAAMALFNPDGGYWSEYINRIFSGRLNITHRYYEALPMSLLPHTKATMDSLRGFGFIDNAYMSVLFYDGLLIALLLLFLLCAANRKLLWARRTKELVFISTFCVYAMMEEFPLNPVVNPFIMLCACVLYREFKVDGAFIVPQCRKRCIAANGKQNILLVHNYYKIAGGEDTVVANEKKLLEENGHRVFLYARSNRELDTFHLWQKLCLPLTSIFSLKTYREVREAIERYDIDVVHVHNTLSLISPSVYYAARSMGTPVVQTMHNFRLLCPAGSFYRRRNEDEKDSLGIICEECIEQGLSHSISHRCYRDSAVQTAVSAAILWIHRVVGTYRQIYFICLSEFNAKKLLLLNHGRKPIISRKRIFIKPNFTYPKDERQDKQDYYVFVGRLEELKGVYLWLEAFAQLARSTKLKTCTLKVMGSGPLREKLAKELAKRGIKNIELLGRVEGEQYDRILSQAKALITTSQCYETFGMVVAEAYAAGVPVIAGNMGNLGALVYEGRTGFHYQYNSAQELVNAICKMEQLSDEEYRRMCQNAYKYYIQHLTKEDNYRMLKEIYDTVLYGTASEWRMR